jgi:hypothetical protein
MTEICMEGIICYVGIPHEVICHFLNPKELFVMTSNFKDKVCNFPTFSFLFFFFLFFFFFFFFFFNLLPIEYVSPTDSIVNL